MSLPVSYTHLDVYKRQVYKRELERRKPKGPLPPPRHPVAGFRPANEQLGPTHPATAAVTLATVVKSKQQKKSKGPKQSPVVQATSTQAPS